MDTRTLLIQELCNRIVSHAPKEDGSTWPSGARELRKVLVQASVPLSCVDHGHPDVDDHAQYLFSMLCSGTLSAPRDVPVDDLASTLKAALRACELVRSQYFQYQHDTLAPDYSTALVYAIMSACDRIDREVLLESDAWIAVPRIPGAHPAMHYVCTSLQIPLAAAICAGDTDAFPIHNPKGPAPEAGDPAYAAEALDEMPWASQATHVFRRWLPSTNDKICGLPFLCMASMPELKVVISAVMHQRCVWGIPHPVVGVAFDRKSTRVAFVLGWYEENPESTAFPQIHMCDLGPQMVFDLSDPQDAQSTFKVVSALRSLSRDLYTCANSRSFLLQQPVCLFHQWRADTFNFLYPSGNTSSTIARWAEQCIPLTEYEMNKESLLRKAHFKLDISAALELVESGQAHKIPKDQREVVERVTASLKSNPEGSEDYAEFMEISSQLLASLGCLKSATLDDNWIVKHWMMDRFALIDSAASDENHWNTLRRFTRLYWPKDSLAFDKDKQKWIPAPDSGLALSEMQLERFNELFSTLSMYKALNPQLVCEYSIKELQADDNRATTASDAEELDGYFREALPLILETYGLLHSIAKDADGGVGINEATWRVPIDGLHMSLFSNHKHQFRGPMHIITGWASAGPVADGRNWMERTLKLPLNLAYHRHLSQPQEQRTFWGYHLFHLARAQGDPYHLNSIAQRWAELESSSGTDLGERARDAMDPAKAKAVGEKARKEKSRADWVARARSQEQDATALVALHVDDWMKLLDDVHVLHRAALWGGTAIADAYAFLRVPFPMPQEVLNRFALSSVSSGPNAQADPESSAHDSTLQPVEPKHASKTDKPASGTDTALEPAMETLPPSQRPAGLKHRHEITTPALQSPPLPSPPLSRLAVEKSPGKEPPHKKFKALFKESDPACIAQQSRVPLSEGDADPASLASGTLSSQTQTESALRTQSHVQELTSVPEEDEDGAPTGAAGTGTQHPRKRKARDEVADVKIQSDPAEDKAPADEESVRKKLALAMGPRWHPDIKIVTQYKHARNPPLPDGMSLLHLPVLIAEWKKEGSNIAQALNQESMNLVAATRFLEACGITDFPVFGLNSDGPVLNLDYAYSGDEIKIPGFAEPSAERPVLVCDRHSVTFNLRNPMCVWHLATTMISINRLHVLDLLDKWETARRDLREIPSSSPDDPRWLHGWDLHGKVRLPQWTISQTITKNSIKKKIEPLKAEFKDDVAKLENLDKIEKLVAADSSRTEKAKQAAAVGDANMSSVDADGKLKPAVATQG